MQHIEQRNVGSISGNFLSIASVELVLEICLVYPRPVERPPVHLDELVLDLCELGSGIYRTICYPPGAFLRAVLPFSRRSILSKQSTMSKWCNFPSTGRESFSHTVVHNCSLSENKGGSQRHSYNLRRVGAWRGGRYQENIGLMV